MSLLQYGFKRQRINDNLTQENEKNSENPPIDLKNSSINKTFKIKWLSEFSWLRYDDKNRKM
jgi:hypothetical protein